MSRAPIRELLLGAGLALLVFACAPSAGKPPESIGRAPAPPTDPRLQEIQKYWDDIREDRGKLDLELFPSEPSIRAAKAYRFGALCPDHDSMSQECDENCNLADHICENAEQICTLSDDLEGTTHHDWAAEKCDQGRASCKEARQKCCDCNAKNGVDDADASGTW